MTMATCYANYELSISRGIAPISAASQSSQQQLTDQLLQPQQQSSQISSAAAATAHVLITPAASSLTAPTSNNINTQKDYSIPLHVDCSVEYELPNQPKPPPGQRVEPLLMIHPCYFRKMESQRRSPFVNNMPISRHGAALLVGVSHSAVSSSTTTGSSRRSSTRQQHQSQVFHTAHLNSRQSSGTQYNTMQHHTNQQQQYLRSLQSNTQQMSQMSQQAHYPVVSLSSSVSSVNGQYIEHASTTRRVAAAAASSVHRSQDHSRHQSHKHQHNLLVQNSSSSIVNQWDQLAAVATIVTSIAPRNSNIIPPTTNMCSRNLCSVKCCPTSTSVVGKRDAMISGGYAPGTNLRSQSGRMSNNTNSSSKHNEVSNNSQSISTSLVDTTNVRGSTTAYLMTDRSPIATVPSNYQAGPDTTPTIIQNTRKTNNDNSANIKHNMNCGKYRQYLRSHRAHPYLVSSTHPSSAPSRNNVGQGFSQFSTTTAPVSNPSFQQHLQQISCYNV